MKKLIAQLTLGLFSVSIMQACAQDRDPESYRQEQDAANLTQYQAAAGNYVGIAQSSLGNRQPLTVAAVTMKLIADTKTQPSPDGLSNEQTPVMTGSITVVSETENFELQFTNGNFTPSTNAFDATFQVQNYSDPSSTQLQSVDIHGTAVGGKFVGTVSIQGATENQLTITAAIGGTQTSAIEDHASFLYREDQALRESFAGSIPANSNGGVSEAPPPVNPANPQPNAPAPGDQPTSTQDRLYMVFTDDNLTPAQKFYDMVSPVQAVNVTLNRYHLSPLPPQQSILIPLQFTGTLQTLGSQLHLEAKTTTTGTTSPVSFNNNLICDGALDSAGEVNWSCTLTSTGALGPIPFTLSPAPSSLASANRRAGGR